MPQQKEQRDVTHGLRMAPKYPLLCQLCRRHIQFRLRGYPCHNQNHDTRIYQQGDEHILKNNSHYTMPNQNLQILIVILVINVMMSGIRSSSCFDVDVPGENNENETST